MYAYICFQAPETEEEKEIMSNIFAVCPSLRYVYYTDGSHLAHEYMTCFNPFTHQSSSDWRTNMYRFKGTVFEYDIID